jgi:hypothetical protein
MLHSHQPILCSLAHRHTTPPHHAVWKPHMCVFTVCIQGLFVCMLLGFTAHMMTSFMHGACVCVATSYFHVACLCQGFEHAVYICACMWVAWMHAACSIHVCVVCILVTYKHAWGCIVLILLVAKLPEHLECKISLNYLMHNVESGKFSTI